MVIQKSALVQNIQEGVDALNSIENASIDVRSAALKGQQFLSSLAVIDPIEFNNVEGGEAIVTEAPEPTEMAEDLEVTDPVQVTNELNQEEE